MTQQVKLLIGLKINYQHCKVLQSNIFVFIDDKMPAKLSNAEFVCRMNNINPNIIFETEYNGRDKPVQCRCTKCEHRWTTTPNILFERHGCANCAGVRRKTHDEFVEELETINPYVEVIGQYINMRSRIKVICLKHKCEWETTPLVLLKGSGCPICKSEAISSQKRRKHADFIELLNKENPYVVLLEKYENEKIKKKFQCKICGNIWSARPEAILSGQGCPKCALSHGEKRIATFLESHKIEYCTQYKFKDCKNVYHLRFDFYIPKINMCIEFDGKQHFSPFSFGERITQEEMEINLEKVQYNDNIKNEYCKAHGINLLRITYKDYKNIEKILLENVLLLYNGNINDGR